MRARRERGAGPSQGSFRITGPEGMRPGESGAPGLTAGSSRITGPEGMRARRERGAGPSQGSCRASGPAGMRPGESGAPGLIDTSAGPPGLAGMRSGASGAPDLISISGHGVSGRVEHLVGPLDQHRHHLPLALKALTDRLALQEAGVDALQY